MRSAMRHTQTLPSLDPLLNTEDLLALIKEMKGKGGVGVDLDQ